MKLPFLAPLWRFLALVALLQSFLGRAQATGCAGRVDPGFAPPYLSAAGLSAVDGDGVLVASNGKILRLRSDGALDPRFVADTASSAGETAPYVLKPDGAGRWLIGGEFTRVNSEARTGIARLLAGGDVDRSFTSPSGLGLRVYSLSVQNDGKIWVAGSVTNLGAIRRPAVLRLFADGSLDAAIVPELNGFSEFKAVLAQADGGVIVGGTFNTINGQVRRRVARFTSAGQLDANFLPEYLVSNVTGLQAQPDGKLLVYSAGFSFGDEETPAPYRFARLNADGSTDSGFSPSAMMVTDVALQSDGKILVNGPSVRRCLPNGTLDTGFQSNIPVSFPPFSAPLGSISLDSTGRIVVSGMFGAVDGLARPGVARLINDDHPCTPLVSFESNSMRVNEANPALVDILRSGDLSSETRIRLMETNIVFAPNESRKTVNIPLGDDQRLETTESITLSLELLTPNAAYGRHRVVTLEVRDATASTTAGQIDPTFVFETDLGTAIQQIEPLPGGGFLVKGDFPTVNGNTAKYVARLSSSGAVDPGFHYDSEYPRRIAVWGEKFYGIHALPGEARIRRYNADGSIDLTFSSPSFTYAAGASLECVAAQPDGKALVAGQFTEVNGASHAGLARLNVDGSVDATFDAGMPFPLDRGYGISAMLVLPDGSILVGGYFPSFSGMDRLSIAQLSATGALLGGFDLRNWSQEMARISTLLLEPGGSVLAGGECRLFGDSTSRNLIRFENSGQLDESFQREPEVGYVTGLARQSGGKIIVGSLARGGAIARLHPNGALDPTFYFPGSNFSQPVVAVMSDGAVLAGGWFGGRNLIRLGGGGYSGPGIFELHPGSNALDNEGFLKARIKRGWSTTGEARVRFRTLPPSAQDPVFAQPGVNYTPVDTEVIFSDGESEKIVNIPLVDAPILVNQLLLEGEISAVSPGTAVLDVSRRTWFSISDDEPTLQVRKTYQRFREADSLWGFSVELHGPIRGPVSVEAATIGGTAIPGQDYIPTVQTLEFDENWRTREFWVQFRDDAISDPDKTIRFEVRKPVGATLVGETSFDIVIDDDAEQFIFQRYDVVATQDDGAVTLVVRPANVNTRAWQPVTINYKTEGGTAVPGLEYAPQEGTIVFAPGDIEDKAITIPLLPNHIVGAPTTFQVKITGIGSEAFFLNPVATVKLLHPPAVISAGGADRGFTPIPSKQIGYLNSFKWTPNYLYLVGSIPDETGGSAQLLRYRPNGELDGGFRPYFNGGVYRVAGTPDGKLVAIGNFTEVSGVAAFHVARLNGDGSADPAFQPSISGAIQISKVEVDGNGGVILGGVVPLGFDGGIPYLARLNPNGAPDRSFGPVRFNAPGGYINDLKLQPDGRILVAGQFTGALGTPRQNLLRLNPDGTLDSAFVPPSGLILSAYELHVQPDGKIWVWGTFVSGSSQLPDLFRLNPDGSVDESLHLAISDDEHVSLRTVDAAGRLYFLVSQTPTGGPGASRLVRFLGDGTIDPNFAITGIVGKLAAAPDGLYALGSYFEGAPLLRRFYSDPPRALDEPERLDGNRVALRFNVAPNIPYVLEKTADFVNWSEAGSGSSASGYVRIEMPAPDERGAFYRLRQQ